MLRFLDGPAAGVNLCCARAPLLLRVVQGSDGQWDALDQLDDMPELEEQVHVYAKVSDDGTVHYSGRDRHGKRFGRWEQCASYRLYDQQPEHVETHDTAAWRAWASAHRPEQLP